MMFAIAGIISWKMLPDDRNMRIFTAGGKKKGLSARLAITILMAFFFSVFEFFLVLTPSFLWVRKWWGAIPVFILIYIPLFWVANYVPDFSKKGRALYLGILWGLVAVLLATLIPLGII